VGFLLSLSDLVVELVSSELALGGRSARELGKDRNLVDEVLWISIGGQRLNDKVIPLKV